MPRVRRSGRLRANPQEIAGTFLYSDGVRALLDGDYEFENIFLARAAWPTYRARTWDLWEKHGLTGPPRAAVAYDGMTDYLHDPRCGGSTSDYLRAARADLRSLTAHRKAKPAVAQDAEPHLSTYEGILLASISFLESVPRGTDPGPHRPWIRFRHSARTPA